MLLFTCLPETENAEAKCTSHGFRGQYTAIIGKTASAIFIGTEMRSERVALKCALAVCQLSMRIITTLQVQKQEQG